MLTKHVARSSRVAQVVLVVLVALVLVAVVVAVNIHSTINSSQIAASWGNSVCRADTLASCTPPIEIAASWGNMVSDSNSQ